MNNKMGNLFVKILWSVFSIIEKTYWFAWRNVQKQKLLACGKNVFISRHCHLTNETISIGNDVYIGQGCRFQSTLSKITIGNHVMFGPNVSIHGGNHRTDLIGVYMKDISLNDKLPENDQDVIISDDVWVGANAIILKGVTIGEGSIVGAGSIVTTDVPPYTIIVGSKPQKTFQRWDSNKIEQHKKIISSKNSSIRENNG